MLGSKHGQRHEFVTETRENESTAKVLSRTLEKFLGAKDGSLRKSSEIPGVFQEVGGTVGGSYLQLLEF